MVARERYTFRVTNHADGAPFIALDALERHLPCLSQTTIAFELAPGTTQRQADEFAQLLNSQIASITQI